MPGELDWLPERPETSLAYPDWQQLLAHARTLPPAEALPHLLALARTRLDLARTVKLDRALQAHIPDTPLGLTPIRLAILGSSTLTHLLPAIRVAGLRRNLWIDIYEGPYASYRQELASASDPASPLARFRPNALLLALDAHHALELEQAAPPAGALATLQTCWRLAQPLGCAILQQTLLPLFPPLLGSAESLLPSSPASILERLNAQLPAAAHSAGVHLLALDRFARPAGLDAWHSPALWFRARQEVHPAFAPLYGDHVARVLAALFGTSAKCLVLDLDHTLWGGGIGDDGLEGLVLGQGSPAGEAHLALQRYAIALKDRGIVLAVCSKNDESNALLPFQHHPGMLLRRSDIACFVANWNDKATNLRRIARELALGLESLVFVDDNPAERGLIRRELPEVHVPELPQDPAGFVPTLAAAGYFESAGLTPEDRSRAASYAANAAAAAARPTAAPQTGGTPSSARPAGGEPDPSSAPTGPQPTATGLDAFLASLRMHLEARPFDQANRTRIVQLINKTNQFNLTTQRVSASDIDRLIASPAALTLQLRLQDLYGDHGAVALLAAEPEEIVILSAAKDLLSPAPPTNPAAPANPAAPQEIVILSAAKDLLSPAPGPAEEGAPGLSSPQTLLITHFLMSCRVLGREVEHAALNLLVAQARARGIRRLLGLYLPTPKNAMVRELYPRLGFTLLSQTPAGATLWSLDLETFQPLPTHIAASVVSPAPALA